MDNHKPRLRLIMNDGSANHSQTILLPGLGMLLQSEAQPCRNGGIDVLYYEQVHIDNIGDREFRRTADPSLVELLRVRLHIELNPIERLLGVKLGWKVRLYMWHLCRTLRRQDRDAVRSSELAQRINRGFL
jgi:hypothetical protein